MLVVYKSDPLPQDLDSDFAIRGCLFGGVKLAKNADPDKYVYSGCGTGLNMLIEFRLPDGSVVKNDIIFGDDMSSWVHIDNKGKYILILGKSLTQGLNNTMLIAETQYSINFTISHIKFLLSLHYNESNRMLFVNATKRNQLKVKYSEIKKYSLCLGNMSGEFFN